MCWVGDLEKQEQDRAGRLSSKPLDAMGELKTRVAADKLLKTLNKKRKERNIMAATRNHEYSAFDPVLYLAFELSNVHWKLGFATGPGRRPRVRTINAGDLAALQEEVRRAKKRFELSEDIRVVSCTVLRQHGLRGRERWLPWTVRPGQAGCTAFYWRKGSRTLCWTARAFR